MKLYRLRSLEGKGLLYTLDMMVSERIYLSTCESMNDVDEGRWNDSDKRSSDYLKKSKKLRYIVDATRFTSFLGAIDNPLMWAHYAGGFSGVALEYDLDPAKYDIRKIDYTGLPTVSIAQIEDVISGNKLPQDIGILKEKASCWSYEEEWRLYGVGQERYIEGKKPKSVIFGFKPNDNDSVLREIALKFGVRVGYLNLVTESEYEVVYVQHEPSECG